MIITLVLALFVAAAVGVLIFDMRDEGRVGNGTAPEPGEDETAVLSGGPGGLPDRVVAYYFYGNKRCATCRNIEAYTREALRANFAGELEAGELEMQFVNVDIPSNEHFIEDFDLLTKSVVLVRISGGRVVEWRNLDRIWDLAGTRKEFIEYISGETERFMGGGA
jgi:hypothetical protein